MREFKITVYNNMTEENKHVHVSAFNIIDAIDNVSHNDVNHAVEDIVKVEKINNSIGFETPKEKAQSMVIDIKSKFRLSKNDAVRIAIYTIETMLFYNPLPVNPDNRKKEYHEYWNGVKKLLTTHSNYIE